MGIVPTPDPASEPDDELAQATAESWWSPIAARLLDQLEHEPQPDDDPAHAPGR